MMTNNLFKKAMATALALTLVGGVSATISGTELTKTSMVAYADGEEASPIVIAKGIFFEKNATIEFDDDTYLSSVFTGEEWSSVPFIGDTHITGVSIDDEGEDWVEVMASEDSDIDWQLKTTYADTNTECTDVQAIWGFKVYGEGTEEDPFYLRPLKNEPGVLTSEKNKQAADKDGVHYVRYVFAEPKSAFADASKAVFTAKFNGVEKTFETSTYYTGLTTNGQYFTTENEDTVLFVVTIAGVPADKENDLDCSIKFE